MKTRNICLSAILTCLFVFSCGGVFAQGVPEPKPSCAYCGAAVWKGESHRPGCPYAPKKTAPKAPPKAPQVGGYRSSEDLMRGMAMNLLSSMISAALNPQPQVDPAYQKWLEEEARRKREEARKRRLQKFQQMKKNYDRQREKDNQQLISMFDVAGSNDSPGMESTEGGSLEGFDWYVPEIPENELQPRGTGKYDTSKLSFLQRLSCVNDFSQRALAAANNGDHVNARYLNEQAQKVMAGQMTDCECQFPDLPDVPEPPKPQPQEPQGEMAFYENMIKSVQQDIKKLQDIEIKLKETDEKIKQAEEKKKQAEQMITEIKSRSAAADKPEDKQKDDDLLAQALRAEQEAKQQLQEATAAKQNYLVKKENITNKLKEVQKSIQQPPGSN